MKKRLCILALCMSLIFLSLGVPFSASAAGVGDPNDGYWRSAFVVPYSSQSFSSAWQKTYVDPNNSSNYLIYGYEREWFTWKDFCTSYHYTEFHCAKYASNGTWYTSNDQNARYTTTVSNKHTSDNVYGYGCYTWVSY